MKLTEKIFKNKIITLEKEIAPPYLDKDNQENILLVFLSF